MTGEISSKCTLYVIRVGSGAVKIGISSDLESRIQDIQANNHERITVAYSFEFESFSRARTVEAALHRRYAELNIHHEWFNVEPDTIIKDMEFAMSFVDGLVSVDKATAPRRLSIVVSKATEATNKVSAYFEANPAALYLKGKAAMKGIARTLGVGVSTVYYVRAALLIQDVSDGE